MKTPLPDAIKHNLLIRLIHITSASRNTVRSPRLSSHIVPANPATHKAGNYGFGFPPRKDDNGREYRMRI